MAFENFREGTNDLSNAFLVLPESIRKSFALIITGEGFF